VTLVQSDMEWIFPVHMKEKKKIREITTVSAPVNGKIHSMYITLNQRQLLRFGTV
jgi:hypothetical protein